MKIDLKECGQRFSANTTEGEALRLRYGWHGPLVGIAYNSSSQISREGCLKVCGNGIDTYPWSEVSSTITTWILPVVGTLLQAPFESNATKRTFLAISRWVGSPIASLSYVLWNIKVSAKAALMVDMAVKYDETPDRRTDFGSMRDSMYLLLAMNQYTLKQTPALREKEAEGLLRIVLFSKDLKLTDTDKTLRQMRRILAREVREMRRRGAVPVFVSIMWFLFAFALSIQAAFGDLGQNTTAHDLALGCLLAWFPILIMGSVVDRNPIAAEAIRKKLNALVDHVRHALRDERHRNEFVDTFQDQPEFDQLNVWVDNVANKGEDMYDFFGDFAGQARVRWHYGAAHPILCDIENCYIADKGRNWLANEKEARVNLVIGPVNDEGLVWFDIREFWQVASAIIIVAASCGGAFILSFFTPTVGLGCRSGGYTIFFTVAFGLLFFEMTVWLILSPYEVEPPWLVRTTTLLHNHTTFNRWEGDAHDKWNHLKRRVSSFLDKTQGLFVRCIVGLALLYPWNDKAAVRERVASALRGVFRNVGAMSLQRKWEVFFFRPVEIFNAIWLVYIVLAQTFGWYKTCDCITSNWGGAGGYLDFSVQDTSNSRWVLWYWTSGTVLTSTVMWLSIFYITVEWCQQSFLSTEDYKEAMDGLRKTRMYRHWSFPVRWLSRQLSRWTLDPMEKLAVLVGLVKKPQKTLLWTKGHKWDPVVPQAKAMVPAQINPSPYIELTDYSTTAPHMDTHIHDTPAMAHSLFPPAIPTRRPRNESDASLLPPSRTSDDSSSPLIQRPSEAHHQRVDSEGRRSGEGRVSFGETWSPATPADARPAYGGGLGADATVHSRQGYQRANSDPGSLPVDIAEMAQSGLVIHFRNPDPDLERGPL
ncbi:uncharacterized protein K460DRAFT_322312 [Cucurbitaria berberidis CBS 394.84]|uniref:Uncharacterized protein n=1 Tax=Cucurbitaria berberidis CBS 394.84 TaxID=1168544 RepID=A0A9P4G8V5_9PLEO|nr:uncharacterized protein K460DRAFT_322312 [Cucurbitaria berberidis CBS 394.84]KAF1841258.1 hypothetical protein K460DRAFT_322312 [Cucurbitaria berberidis CBS 394.84]